MKKYTAPSCEVQIIDAANMLAESLGVYNDKTTSDGGWTRGQSWNAESWTSEAESEE